MISYRLLSFDELHIFQKIHNDLFKRTDISFEWINWYFYEIGHSMVRVYGAFDEDEIIGCWCVEPKKLNLNGSVIDVGRCFAVGIRDDYRRRGLFIELSKFAIEKEKEIAKYEYVLGFPQVGKPVISGHLKSGWEFVQSIQAMAWETTKPSRMTSLLDVSKVSDFSFLNINTRDCGGFVEDAQYRNVKWLNHPDHNYVCLSSESSYIVLKPYGQICHILDVRGSSRGVETLLDAAKTLAYRHGWQSLTTWCSDNEQFVWEITESDFKPASKHCLSIEMLAVRINAKEALKFNENTHFMQCVEEIY